MGSQDTSSSAYVITARYAEAYYGLTTIPQVRSDAATEETATVLVALGDEFGNANAAVMYQARNLVTMTKQSTRELDSEMEARFQGVESERMENWYDGLGYCEFDPNARGLHILGRACTYPLKPRYLERPRSTIDGRKAHQSSRQSGREQHQHNKPYNRRQLAVYRLQG